MAFLSWNRTGIISKEVTQGMAHTGMRDFFLVRIIRFIDQREQLITFSVAVTIHSGTWFFSCNGFSLASSLLAADNSSNNNHSNKEVRRNWRICNVKGVTTSCFCRVFAFFQIPPAIFEEKHKALNPAPPSSSEITSVNFIAQILERFSPVSNSTSFIFLRNPSVSSFCILISLTSWLSLASFASPLPLKHSTSIPWFEWLCFSFVFSLQSPLLFSLP